MFNKLSEVMLYYQDYGLLNSKHRYQYRFDNLLFFDAYKLSEIRRKHIKEYAKFRQLKVKNSTINRELSFARASINCVNYDFEINLYNPFTYKLFEDDYIARFLTRSEYERLLKSCLTFNNHNLHDFVKLLVMTGCRPIEVLTLEWSNVYLEKRYFIVRNFYSKNKRTMYKYLNDTALQLLHSRFNHHKYVFTNPKTMKPYTTFGKSFKRACDRAGLLDVRLYDLRHTFASWLVQEGHSIYLVKDLLGHCDLSSTQRYAHLSNQNFLDALSTLQ